MTRRTARVAEAVREVVSTAILLELRDPRIKGVTVLGAEVPTDLRTAKVTVSVMGGAKNENLAMQGLDSARGYLQRKVGDRLDLRFVPILSFKLDRGLKSAAETARILHELQEREGPLGGNESQHDESVPAPSWSGDDGLLSRPPAGEPDDTTELDSYDPPLDESTESP